MIDPAKDLNPQPTSTGTERKTLAHALMGDLLTFCESQGLELSLSFSRFPPSYINEESICKASVLFRNDYGHLTPIEYRRKGNRTDSAKVHAPTWEDAVIGFAQLIDGKDLFSGFPPKLIPAKFQIVAP